MIAYTSQHDIARFLSLVAKREGQQCRPAFGNDLDGNLLIGYSLAPVQKLALSQGDDPCVQTIPFGSTPAQIQAWVRQGILREGIFAEKPMDARLPESLVVFVNKRLREGAAFDVTFLASKRVKSLSQP
jgi:hypothetical protein